MNSNPTYKSIWKLPILASPIKSAQAPKAVDSRVTQVMTSASAFSSQFPVTKAAHGPGPRLNTVRADDQKP